jgi:hypothetical protein
MTVFAAAVLTAGLLSAPANGVPAVLVVPDVPVLQSDLDEFMKAVLAARDENWKKLQQYILDEDERIEVRGPTNLPVWGDKREYAWYIREGYFVRSPVKANGVEVPDDDRRKYEDDYLRRAKARDHRGEKGRGAATIEQLESEPPADEPKSVDAFLTQVRRPQFVDSAYFLRFKFEQGKYALVGRETFDGRDVLRIEYYPAKLFSHEDEQKRKRDAQKKPNRGEDMEATMERLMNKVALVTLWVEPKSRQIVKYTFDNVNFDFLPAAWLLRVDDLKASMTMSQPFKDVWLPRDVEFYFSSTLAIGSFSVRYRLDYHDYREAKTSGRIKGGTQ